MAESTLGIPQRSVDAYASALCLTCPWKLSGADEEDTPPRVRRDADAVTTAAREHAEQDGHAVSLIVTKHLTFDYRVEREG